MAIGRHTYAFGCLPNNRVAAVFKVRGDREPPDQVGVFDRGQYSLRGKQINPESQSMEQRKRGMHNIAECAPCFRQKHESHKPFDLCPKWPSVIERHKLGVEICAFDDVAPELLLLL